MLSQGFGTAFIAPVGHVKRPFPTSLMDAESRRRQKGALSPRNVYIYGHARFPENLLELRPYFFRTADPFLDTRTCDNILHVSLGYPRQFSGLLWRFYLRDFASSSSPARTIGMAMICAMAP